MHYSGVVKPDGLYKPVEIKQERPIWFALGVGVILEIVSICSIVFLGYCVKTVKMMLEIAGLFSALIFTIFTCLFKHLTLSLRNRSQKMSIKKILVLSLTLS
jgi:hypothetical protein